MLFPRSRYNHKEMSSMRIHLNIRLRGGLSICSYLTVRNRQIKVEKGSLKLLVREALITFSRKRHSEKISQTSCQRYMRTCHSPKILILNLFRMMKITPQSNKKLLQWFNLLIIQDSTQACSPAHQWGIKLSLLLWQPCTQSNPLFILRAQPETPISLCKSEIDLLKAVTL